MRPSPPRIPPLDTELVTVTNVIQLGDGTSVVTDYLDFDFDGRRPPFNVQLDIVTPDGNRVSAIATIVQPMVRSRPPMPAGLVCSFANLEKSEIPIGSHIVLPSA